jgi:acylphosphatase
MTAPTARHFHVTGRVQGVAFRWSTQRQAGRLGLVGWVRNLADGRVEGVIQGPPAAVEQMLEWLAHGPPSARVDHLAENTHESRDDLTDFSIRSIG